MNAKIKLFPKQKEAYKLLTDPTRTNVVAYGGGARGGKSHLGCVWVVTMCFNLPQSQWLIGFESLKHLRRTTLPDLIKVIKNITYQTCGDNWNKTFKINQQDMIIEFINGSVIYLAELADLPSDPDYDRLGSYSLTGFWVDEVQKVKQKAVDTLFARLSLTETKVWKFPPKALLTCNPNKGFIYRDFWKPIVKEKKEKLILKFGKSSVYRYFVTSLYSDNPHINHEEYRSTIMQTNNKVQIERLLKGNFEYDDNSNKLFNYDAILNMFHPQIAINQKYYITCDVATMGNDKAVIFLWRGFFIVKIKVFAKSTLQQLQDVIENWREEKKILKQDVLVDDGGVGTGLRMYGGYTAFVSNAKAIDSHLNKVNNYQNLKAQCVDYMSKEVNNNNISITTNITLEQKESLIQELETFERWEAEKDGKFKIMPKEKQKEIIGRSPDFADAFIMRAFFEIKPKRVLLCV